MSKLHESIKREIELYARHMPVGAAANKVKAPHLGRLDFIVDDVLKNIK